MSTGQGDEAAAPPPSLPDLPDAVLARRAGLGDRDALAEIFHRHAGPVHRYALTMLDGHHAEAEDAVQTVWIKVWQALPSFRGQSALRTWLFSITANTVLDARRRRRPIAVDDHLLTAMPVDPTEDPAAQVRFQHTWEALLRALSELPWRQRACWILREMESMSYDEIAIVLDTTPGVVRGQLHRARRTVAIRMEQWR